LKFGDIEKAKIQKESKRLFPNVKFFQKSLGFIKNISKNCCQI